MQFQKKAWFSSLVSAAYLGTSWFLDIIPCQVSPKVPNPSLTWTLCNNNPDLFTLEGVQKVFWGITPSLTQSFIFSLIFSFLASFVLLSFTFKKSKHKKEE